MAITSTVAIDGVLGTAILTITNAGLFETITYTNSTQQITFATRNAVTLSFDDFIATLKLIINFNIVIQSPPFTPLLLTAPIASTNLTVSDDGINQLAWTFQPGVHPLFDFTCTYPLGGVVIAKRSQVGTLTFPQWLYLMYCFINYTQIVHAVYKK